MTADDQQKSGPQEPPVYRPGISYGKKIILMGVICGVLMIGVFAIWLLVYSRESSNHEVQQGITLRWGDSVFISGPMFKVESDSAEWAYPSVFDCRADVATQSLHRGIYEAEVYTADVNLSGTLDIGSLPDTGDKLVVKIIVPEDRIVSLGGLRIGTSEYSWNKSEDCILASLCREDLNDKVDFSTDLTVRGSESLSVSLVGLSSSVILSGQASNPSFNGTMLPVDRMSENDRFSAEWKRSFDSFDESMYETASVRFLVGVDRYRKVNRSLKYSFIIIILTFISVLFVEIMRKHPIPLLNYFLIGVALIVFYSLLLSFAELMSFGPAYLIAAGMTVALITGYIWKMLQSRTLGLSIGAVLSLIYIFCYILMCISTYALLLGSLLLFFTLAAMMYASLKIRR